MLVGEELQRLYVSTIQASPDIMALAYRVYDAVPAEPFGGKTAYISMDGYDAVDDGADCIDGLAITIQLDVWSIATGSLECKNIVEMLRRLFHEAQFDLVTNAMVESRVEFTRVITDADGVTSHGIVQVTAYVEVPE